MTTNIVYIDDDADALKQAGDQSKEQETKTDKEVSAKADDNSESEKAEESTEEKSDEAAGSEELEAAKEDESDEESEEQQEEKPKKKGGFKRKIDRLQSEIAFLKEQISKGAATQQQEQAQKPDAVVSADKPVRDNFESLEEYLEAVADWKVEKKLADAEAKKAQESLKAESEKKVLSYNDRLEATKKELKDYEDVISDFIEEHGDIKFSKAMQDLIMESELGPKAIYELAKNKELLDKMNGLSPLAAAKEFGKLEDKISTAKKPEVKLKTSATPPLKTIAAQKATVKKDLSDPDLSFEEFDRLMNEREAKQRQQYRRY